MSNEIQSAIPFRLASRIVAIQEAKGYTQGDLAAASGLSKTTISNTHKRAQNIVADARYNPQLTTLLKICRGLDISFKGLTDVTRSAASLVGR
jgi:transcriptional regulator with XRE-family HTH domain